VTKRFAPQFFREIKNFLAQEITRTVKIFFFESGGAKFQMKRTVISAIMIVGSVSNQTFAPVN
jgi:hypothetical protein